MLNKKAFFQNLFVGPLGPLIFPLSLFFIAFFFPINLYEYYMNENDYIFLNFSVFAYIVFSIFFYYIGIHISNYKSYIKSDSAVFFRKKNNFKYLMPAVIIILIVELLYIIVLNQYYRSYLGSSMFLLLFSGLGDVIKQSGTPVLPYHLNALPRILPAIMFWLLYEMYGKVSTDGFVDKIVKKVIFIESLLLIIIFFFSLDRTAFVIFILGWISIYSFFNRGDIIKVLLKIFLIIIGMFILTSLLRWLSSAGDDISFMLVNKLMGYTIVNYNRLALILSGELNYHLPQGFYLFPIMNIPLTGIFPYEKLKNFTDFANITLSAVESAGLNGKYNQCTLFGGMFQELSIAAPIYFFFLGIIGNRLFYYFKKGGLIGIILYPLFWSSVALWSSDINLFIYNSIYFIMGIAIVMFYIFMLLLLSKNRNKGKK